MTLHMVLEVCVTFIEQHHGNKKEVSVYGQEYFPLSICLHAWKLSYQMTGSSEIKTYKAPVPKI